MSSGFGVSLTLVIADVLYSSLILVEFCRRYIQRMYDSVVSFPQLDQLRKPNEGYGRTGAFTSPLPRSRQILDIHLRTR